MAITKRGLDLAYDALRHEWGSEQQIAAENKFFRYVRRRIPAQGFRDLEDRCHKASTLEQVFYGLSVL